MAETWAATASAPGGYFRDVFLASATLGKRALDFLVGLVLRQRVDGPDRSRQPTDDRQLKQQTDDSRNGRPIVKN